MATQGRSQRFTIGLVTASLPVVLTSVLITQTIAGTGEWLPFSAAKIGAPARNSRLHQQPRPESAPTSSDGEPVQLTGVIEGWTVTRQPRPASAAPRRLDTLILSLDEEQN